MIALTVLLPLAAAQTGANGLITFLPFVLIFVVMYFLMIRPQQKKQKELEAMLSKLTVGDRVLTSSGIYGTIRTVGEKGLTIEIADGVKVEMVRGAVASVIVDSVPEKAEKIEKKAER